MGFDMNKIGVMMKKMQDDMARIQKELEETTIEGADPTGKVTCKVNGHREVMEIKINPAVVDPEDVAMLEDLVLFAVRDAMTKAEKEATTKMNTITGGMPNIPGLKMPF